MVPKMGGGGLCQYQYKDYEWIKAIHLEIQSVVHVRAIIQWNFWLIKVM